MRRRQTDGWFRTEGSGSRNSKITMAPCGVIYASGEMDILHHQIFQFVGIKHSLKISKDKSGSGIELCRKAVGNGFAQVKERRRRRITL